MTSSNLKRKVDPTLEIQPQPESTSHAKDELQAFLTQYHPADQSIKNAADRQPQSYFHGATSTSVKPCTILPKKVLIDLTQDETTDMSEDFLIAQKLQAQFDSESQGLIPPGSPSKKQKRILPTFGSQMEQPTQQSWSLAYVPYDEDTSPGITDEEVARSLQAELDAEDENRLTEEKYQDAEESSGSQVDSTLTLDTQLVHELAESVYQRRCPCCEASLTHDLEQLVRSKHKELLEQKSITGTILCKFCNFAICAGCGKKPEPTQMGRRNERYKEYLVGWHCDDSRKFVLWTLLCMPPRFKSEALYRTPAEHSRMSRSRPNAPSGVGYGNRGTEHRSAQPPTYHPNNQEDIDVLPVLVALLEALPNWQKESAFDRVPLIGLLNAIFRRSPLLEKIAGLLRNDSIHDIAQRQQLYHAVITFMTALAHHSATAALLFQTRRLYPVNHGLMAISMSGTVAQAATCQETTSSLAQLLENQVSQARSFLIHAQRNIAAIEEDQDLQDAVHICERFSELGEFIEANNSTTMEKSVSGKGKAKVVIDSHEWFKENCVTEVDDTVMMKHHHFSKEAAKVVNPPKGRMKKLMMELTSLRTSLPPGIYVKHASSRIDVMKFMIIGPMGSPYENGLFEFDLFCPADYPQSPPKVQFKTTGGGRAHFNPNLYRCGKVCLSLLGTWSGEPWRADQSTLLQVFVSIQSMVLCDEPWTNEPGRELTRGTLHSIKYNHMIRRLTTEHSLIPWAKELEKSSNDEDSLWSGVIFNHFSNNVDRIVYTTARWAEDAVVMSQGPDHRVLASWMHSSPAVQTSQAIASTTLQSGPFGMQFQPEKSPGGPMSISQMVPGVYPKIHAQYPSHMANHAHYHGMTGSPNQWHYPHNNHQFGFLDKQMQSMANLAGPNFGQNHDISLFPSSAPQQIHPSPWAINGGHPQSNLGVHQAAAYTLGIQGKQLLNEPMNTSAIKENKAPVGTSHVANTSNNKTSTGEKSQKPKYLLSPDGVQVGAVDLSAGDFACDPRILPPHIRAKLSPKIWEEPWKPGARRFPTSALWQLLELNSKEILWLDAVIAGGFHTHMYTPWSTESGAAALQSGSHHHTSTSIHFVDYDGLDDSEVDFSDEESIGGLIATDVLEHDSFLSHPGLANASAETDGSDAKPGAANGKMDRSSFGNLAQRLAELLSQLPQGTTTKQSLVQGYNSHIFQELPKLLKQEQAQHKAMKLSQEAEQKKLVQMQLASQAKEQQLKEAAAAVTAQPPKNNQ